MRRQRADRALAEAALPTLRQTSGGWSRGPCPYCATAGHHDRKASFGVHLTSGFFSCFRCSVKGRLDVGTPWFAERQAAPAAAQQEAPAGPPEGYVPIWEDDAWDADCLRGARDYLASRGIGREFAEEVGIGAVLDGRYHHRVIIPVRGLGGEWVGWIGRVWVKKAELPYVYPEGAWRAQSIYNHACLRRETDDPALVVEGAFDAMAVGMDCGVAVLGKPSAWQVDAMSEACRPVVAAMDGDAWRDGMQLMLQLRMRGQRAGTVTLPPGADPDEVPHARLMAAARASLTATEPVEL